MHASMGYFSRFKHCQKLANDRQATYHVRTSPGFLFEGLGTLVVSRVRAARQLLIDRALIVEKCTAPAVDRWRVVGKLVLISKIVAWFVVQAFSKSGTTNCQCLCLMSVILLSIYSPLS